jgi:DNA-binding MarR family transcriptional regulator
VFERLCQAEFGVSRRRWRILATLAAAEGITVSELSKRAELDIAQTSRAIGTLAREGYAKRLANPKNARFAQVILTETGRHLYRSMFVRFRHVNMQLLRDMSEDQVQHLCTAISILRNTAAQLNVSTSTGTPINSKQLDDRLPAYLAYQSRNGLKGIDAMCAIARVNTGSSRHMWPIITSNR